MYGIFGQIAANKIDYKNLEKLAQHSQQSGKASSGLVVSSKDNYKISRANKKIKYLLKKSKENGTRLLFGISSLSKNNLQDSQPVYRDGIIVINNGLIVNELELWKSLGLKKVHENDSEVIIGIAIDHFKKNLDITTLPRSILSKCKGSISALLAIPKIGKAILFSNTGSLYKGTIGQDVYFASESYGLRSISCDGITQVKEDFHIIEIPKSETIVLEKNKNIFLKNHQLKQLNTKEKSELLQYYKPILKRCTKCVLPETFPHISFDSNGVCNYCNNYKKQDKKKTKEEFLEMLLPYRKKNGVECIVPFSGGRDSCYALHIIVNELKMKPITYTYDWGMVTDLAGRNISRMCSMLGVENILVGADITKKRKNIGKNLKAWVKSPHLGMISILTAGDKHFFKYVEKIKKQTNVKLNLWGTNPLEVTHFKAGFLGVKPYFEDKKVYTTGFKKQMRYQWLRFKVMLRNPRYFNSSLFDTLSGEYYRSFSKRSDYFHIFDFYDWDETEVNRVLELYDFEKAKDTATTWRIGDGTAAFYNYVYYTVAGFTEHDTFRSNQIREGQLTRTEALKLLVEDNKPRFESISWYLETLGADYFKVMNKINSIPKLYKI